MAVAATLQAIRSRLQKLLDTQSLDEDWLEHLLDADDLETDFLNGAEHEAQPSADSARADEPFAIDVALLKAQLALPCTRRNCWTFFLRPLTVGDAE